MRRSIFVVVAIVVIVALGVWLWPGEPEDPIRLRGDAASTTPTTPSSVASPVPRAPPAAAPAAQSPPDDPAPLSLRAPDVVRIGSPYEFVVDLGPNAGVGEVAFVARFDPSILQVRGATKGDWAIGAGLDERFDARMSDAADRIDVRSTVSGRRRGSGGGSVAVVQFEPVGRGRTSVTIENLVAKDLSGLPIASVPSTMRLEITAE